MTRRQGYPYNGKKYIGNKNKKEVHDLDQEDTNPNGCQINEIKEVVTFNPDTLQQAHSEGYDNCAKCIGGSRR